MHLDCSLFFLGQRDNKTPVSLNNMICTFADTFLKNLSPHLFLHSTATEISDHKTFQTFLIRALISELQGRDWNMREA